MALQGPSLPSILSHPASTACTRRAKADRICRLSSLEWAHDDRLRSVYVLSDKFAWDAQTLSQKVGRFKVRAQESSADSYISLETEKLEKEKTGYFLENNDRGDQNWLLRLLIVAVVGAAVVSIWQIKGYNLDGQAGNIFGTKANAETGVHFRFNLFGTTIGIRDSCPGWVYFWLLMAAGFGLFISEEALNVWVGTTLSRSLTFNGMWNDFINSVSANATYIFPTIFWVYWGVCISDMVPFYIGKFAAQTKTGEKLRKKVGVSERKLKGITEAVQRYGNLIGFVERFSLGVRNPTSFLAGAMGVSPAKYFTGVCLGALVTLPLQMGLGFVLRDRPMAALTSVAAIVGGWTLLPYMAAGVASLFYVIRNKLQQQHVSSSNLENVSDH